MKIYSTIYPDGNMEVKENLVENNTLEYSCDGLELILKNFQEIGQLSRGELNTKNIKIIHAPSMDENTPVGLEQIAQAAYTDYFNDLFNAVQELQNSQKTSKIGLILHINKPKDFNADAMILLHQMLNNKTFDVHIENLTGSIQDATSLDRTIKNLRAGASYPQIFPCVNICHTIMVWESSYSQYPQDITLWDFTKHFFYLFSKYHGGLIHLSSIRKDGSDCGHGVPFESGNRFDRYLMENIISLYQIFCAPYNIPITFSVKEPDSESIDGYMSTYAMFASMSLRHEESLDSFLANSLFNAIDEQRINDTEQRDLIDFQPSDPEEDEDSDPPEFNVVEF